MGKVIEIENLSKVYDLGLVGTGTLYKDLNRMWAKLRGKQDPYATLVELNDRTQKSSSNMVYACLLYTSPSPRDLSTSRMPSSA